MTFNPRPPAPRRSLLAGAAVSLALFATLVALYSALLIRTRAVEASAAYPAFLAGLVIAGLAIAVGIAAMAVVWRSGRTGGVRAMFAVALGALVLAGPVYVAGRGALGAASADVSTDLADPPRFDRAPRDRAKSDAPSPGISIAATSASAQRAAYPDITTLKLQLSPEEVSNLAVGLVEDRGWRLLGPTAFPRGGPPTGRIEAVARSPVLGLEDDVSIRIRPDAEGARVDMRSASRMPASDFGANAARVKSFLADLTAAANAP